MSDDNLHLEIVIPSYADNFTQPHLSAKQLELTLNGQSLAITPSSFETHLLILFVGATPLETDSKLTASLERLGSSNWFISFEKSSGCPTPYVRSSAELKTVLHHASQQACYPGNAIAQLSKFAGRRVLFLVGSDKDTQTRYEIAKRLIPSIYLVDGGIYQDFYPYFGPSHPARSAVHVQALSSGAKYGLINEQDIAQAAKDALDAAANFYEFVLPKRVPLNSPIRLAFRHAPDFSGSVSLYAQNGNQETSTRMEYPISLGSNHNVLTLRP